MDVNFLDEDIDTETAKNTMLKELKIWIKKYPHLNMTVHPFNISGDSINIGNIFDDSLCGWIDNNTGRLKYTWKMHKWPESNNTKSNSEWIEIFKDISYRTQTQIREQADKHTKEKILGMKIFRYVYFLWLGVIPLLWGLSIFCKYHLENHSLLNNLRLLVVSIL